MSKKKSAPLDEDDAFDQAIEAEVREPKAAAQAAPAPALSPREAFFKACFSRSADQSSLIAQAQAHPEWAAHVDADGFNALTLAALSRKFDLALVLANQGSDVNQPSEAMGWRPLVAACAVPEGSDALARRLLELGADPSSKTHAGLYALVAASTYGNLPLAAQLIQAGAQAAPEDAGCPPIVAAAGSGNAKLVQLLVDHGASPKTTLGERNGFGALHQAAKHGAVDAVALLAKLGADPNGLSNEGDTPLHLAAREGHPQAAAALMLAGADACLENRAGKIPSELAHDPAFSQALATAQERKRSALAGKPRAVGLNDSPEPIARKPKTPAKAASKTAAKPAAKAPAKTAAKPVAVKAPAKPAPKAAAKPAAKAPAKKAAAKSTAKAPAKPVAKKAAPKAKKPKA